MKKLLIVICVIASVAGLVMLKDYCVRAYAEAEYKNRLKDITRNYLYGEEKFVTWNTWRRIYPGKKYARYLYAKALAELHAESNIK